jgi:hypothetical protein
MEMEGIQWQRQIVHPPSCSVLIAWWGQPVYNHLLVALPARHSSNSHVTAVFPLHSGPKHLQRQVLVKPGELRARILQALMDLFKTQKETFKLS